MRNREEGGGDEAEWSARIVLTIGRVVAQFPWENLYEICAKVQNLGIWDFSRFRAWSPPCSLRSETTGNKKEGAFRGVEVKNQGLQLFRGTARHAWRHKGSPAASVGFQERQGLWGFSVFPPLIRWSKKDHLCITASWNLLPSTVEARRNLWSEQLLKSKLPLWPTPWVSPDLCPRTPSVQSWRNFYRSSFVETLSRKVAEPKRMPLPAHSPLISPSWGWAGPHEDCWAPALEADTRPSQLTCSWPAPFQNPGS